MERIDIEALGMPRAGDELGRAAFVMLLEGRPVEPAAVIERTGLGHDEVAEALGALVTDGRARLDERGRIVGLAGLSLPPTRHRMVLGGRSLHTWCAIDAIDIPAGLGADADVSTTCPRCEGTLEVRIRAGRVRGGEGRVAWAPSKACASLIDDWCSEANLFCDVDHLAAWRAETGDPGGLAMTLEDVEEFGRGHWGRLIETPEI